MISDISGLGQSIVDMAFRENWKMLIMGKKLL
jgi:hypothetical protein